MPCFSGIACGWVNTTTNTTEVKSSSDDREDDGEKPSVVGDGDNTVVLYTMKVSPTDLERNQTEEETQQLSPWVAKAVELFTDSIGSEEASDESMLSSEQTAKVNEILDLVLK